MIDDLRELRPGSLLIAREQLRFFVVPPGRPRDYEKRTIKKGEVVLYLDYDIEKTPLLTDHRQRAVRVKLLMGEKVYWATVASMVEGAADLPEDILASGFVLPYFDEANV